MSDFWVWFDYTDYLPVRNTVSIQVVNKDCLKTLTDWNFDDWVEYHDAIPLESEPYFAAMFEPIIHNAPKQVRITIETSLDLLPQFTYRLFK